MRGEFASKRVQVHGHDTHLFDLGKGEPLVLLHGSGAGVSAHSNWSDVIPDLAQQFRVVAPDIAGFGETARQPDIDYSLKLWVAHYVGILDALEIECASIVGNSFGGALGLAVALRHPERVSKLVLLGTPCGDFPMTDGLRAQAEVDGSRASIERALSYFPHDARFLSPELVDARLEAATRPGAMEAFRALMPAPQKGVHPIVHGIPEARLATLPHEALILHGREDRVVPFDRALAMHAALANSQLHSFGQCGHWVQIERRAAFVALVTAFISNGWEG